MPAKPWRWNRTTLAAVAIGLAVVFFFALNILVGSAVRTARLDLTEDGMFTITRASREVLRNIDEPIRLRYYRSERLEGFGPYFANHAARVDEMLAQYARLAGGKLVVERFDPQPYSPEEDLAVADGIQGLTVGEGGTVAYFGIAGTNSTDDRKEIAYLAPERAAFLEYDLTRLVHDLAQPEKPVIAVIGDLPLRGDPLGRSGPWRLNETLEAFFSVRMVAAPTDRIEADVDLLMLAQPASLDDKTRYAIDQFVLAGGKALVFVDPFAEVLAGGRPEAGGGAVAALEPLLTAWGIDVAKDKVVADRRAALRVRARHEGRPVVTDYVAWLGLGKENFDADDAVTGDLQLLVVKTAGAIRAREGATTSLRPLVRTSAEAMEIDVGLVQMLPDPVAILRRFQATGEPFTLAARITGPVRTAFPDGPPEGADEAAKAAHLSEAKAPVHLIVVGDSDLLADENWLQSRSVLGQEFLVPTANNGDFAVAALENLAGGRALAGLRGRGIRERPFEVVETMARAAEDRFRATEQELVARIDETRGKIRQLQKDEKEAGVLLTGEQQRAVENLRGELLLLRGELRQVQFALRKDIEALESWLKLANIWAVPAIVAVVAVILAVLRRRRAARFHARLAVRHGG
jgi:ABC-type uncharacterized transport system involved in gliding motility auxiliary subunit